MKRFVSLILALSMVLALVPVAFAEDTPEKLVYDLGEAFTPVTTFGQGMAADYSQLGFTKPEGTAWSVGYYGNQSGYDTFTEFTKLYRNKVYTRAAGDTVNDTLTVTGEGNSPTTPITAMTMSSSAGVSYFNPESTYYNIHASAADVKGDGGYGIDDGNCNEGSLGYSFGQAKDFKYVRASSLGYQAGASAHQAAIFTAPKAGLIQPSIRTWTGTANALVYQIYKLDTQGNMTKVYPTAEETSATITSPHADITIPEKWQSGWTLLENSYEIHERNDGRIWVNAGDQLILRFAAYSSAGCHLDYALDLLTYTYIPAATVAKTVEYTEDNRVVDVRELLYGSAEDNVFTLPAGLFETETRGVFAIGEDFADGTVAVTAKNGAMSLTINLTIKKQVMTYDLGEAFATSQTFLGQDMSVDYPQAGLPIAGSPNWKVGYYSNQSGYDTFAEFTKLHRYKVYGRAATDRVNDTLTVSAGSNTSTTPITAMTFSNSAAVSYFNPASGYYNMNVSAADIMGDGGYGFDDTNCNEGSLGYSFGQAQNFKYVRPSSLGYQGGTSAHQAAIFTAPRAGLIQPSIRTWSAGNNALAYQIYKLDTKGVITKVYPTAEEASATITSPHADVTVPEKWQNGWTLLETAYAIHERNDGRVWVNAGDQLILRFAAYSSAGCHLDYALDLLTYTYLPMEAFIGYAEEMTVVYPSAKTVDLTRELLYPEAGGTIEYTVSGNEEILQEIALQPGIFALTGVLNAGGEPAVVTASYYEQGKSSANGDAPSFTSSVKVYVNAASTLEDTFLNDTHLVEISRLGYENDGYFLPYYDDSTERAIYGEIDLGLSDAWKNSTVTFDKEGYFEYLGNGRIRAIQEYSYETAGGTPLAGTPNADYHPVSGDPVTTIVNKVLYPRRGQETAGTPVVMTVTAPDGGRKTFNLWSFAAQVTNEEQRYSISKNAPMANEVMKVEAYLSDGSTRPMLPDSTHEHPAFGKIAWSPEALDVYTGMNGDYAPAGPAVYENGYTTWATPSGNAWYYFSNEDIVDYDGISWTFTAPKAGTVGLADYTAFLQTAQQANYNSNTIKEMRSVVRLYDSATATEYTELFACDYIHTYEGRDVAFAGLQNITVGAGATRDEESGELSFKVKAGQVVRVILYTTGSDGAGFTTINGGVLPEPTFGYVGNLPDEFDVTKNLYVTPSSFEGLTDGSNVLALFYDDLGDLLGTVNGADIMANENDGDGRYINIPYEFDNVAYAKVFFWDGLGNITPLADAITVIK